MRVEGLRKKQRRITPDETAYIKRAYEMSVSAIEVAKIFDLSERCVRDRYQKLRGYPLKQPGQLEKSLWAKRKEHETPKPNLNEPYPKRFCKHGVNVYFRCLLCTPEAKKRNESRFYRSDFVPS